MGVRVTGTLDRGSGCYLAGENVNVKIELENEDPQKDDVLAWICLQLYCDRVFLRAGKPAEKPSNTPDSTSVRQPKEAIFSSPPDILLCNWNVPKKSKEIRERAIFIPIGFPPTFKGHFVRYNWQIRVAVQRIDRPIQTLCLPLRVLNSTVNIRTAPPVVENPFLRNDVEQPLPLTEAMEQVEEKTSGGRKMSVYDVVSGGEMFASVSVAAGPFKLGDVVQGYVEFPDAEEGKATCIQMIARVETVEENLNADSNNTNVALQNSTQITTAFMRGCHFRVPLRLSATPTFTEQSVRVKWRLHFEFTITRDTILAADRNVTRPVLTVGVQTLALDHPLFVHCCNPLNVGLVLDGPPATASTLV